MHHDLNYDDIMSKDILDILGLVDIPEEEKEKLKTVMEETIKNRIIARVVDSLPEEELEKWNNLQTAGEKITFLQEHKVGLEKLALEEALMYKYELAKLAGEMHKAKDEPKPAAEAAS